MPRQLQIALSIVLLTVLVVMGLVVFGFHRASQQSVRLLDGNAMAKTQSLADDSPIGDALQALPGLLKHAHKAGQAVVCNPLDHDILVKTYDRGDNVQWVC